MAPTTGFLGCSFSHRTGQQGSGLLCAPWIFYTGSILTRGPTINAACFKAEKRGVVLWIEQPIHLGVAIAPLVILFCRIA